MSQIDLTKVYGLELQSNSYTVREGSFEVASNVVLTQDNIIKKRRGYKLFLDSGGVTLRNLSSYLSKLIGFCADRVQVYNQNADSSLSSISTLGGVTVAITGKARAVASNGNFYFTTDNGVLKLESTTASVLKAGVDSGSDLQIFLQEKSAANTYFRSDSQVAYRVLFGRKDANNNLVLGAPSQMITSTSTSTASLGILVASPNVTITVTTGTGPSLNDIVYISGADGVGVSDGDYVVTASTATTFTIVGTGTPTPTKLNWGSYKTNKLDFSIPAGVNTTQFIAQIYRTAASASALIPPDEATLQLIDQFNLSSTQLSTGFVIYKDTNPDIFRGAFLYTNPNTGEPGGIAAQNDKPPLAKDVALFRNHVFYANNQTPYFLSLSLISSNTTTFPTGSTFQVLDGTTTRTYIGVTSVGNQTVRATSVSNGGTTVTINYTAHGFSNGDTISVAEALDSSGVQLTTLPQGNYVVGGAVANSFTITAPSTPTGITTLSFSGLFNGSGQRFFYILNTGTVASSIDTTARFIVRALNRDSSGLFDASYVSSVTDVPGKMVLKSRSLSVAPYLNTVAAIGASFTPNIPTSGNSVIATRDDNSGVLFVAKPSQPEAVPMARTIPVGSKSNPILRIKALRDSLIVIKSDGVFRVNGNDITNFIVTILDSTVICKSTDSVTVLNNCVFCLSNQGVVSISETAAQIVSRAIEPLILAILGRSDLEASTHAIGYESDRLYLLTTFSPQAAANTPDTVYCLNNITSGWTTWDTIFIDGIVNPVDDRNYYINTLNQIQYEKKSQNRLDFTDAEYPTTVLTTPTTTTATLSIVGGVAAIGDIFIISGSNVINRIVAITSGGSGLVYTFQRPFTFAPGNTGTFYKGISTSLTTSPLSAGDTSRMKQYSEFQVDFRNAASVSRLIATFKSDSTAGTLATTWVNTLSTGGWGDLPWGNFAWGLEDGINLEFVTSANTIMRTYVPLDASRGTYIQVKLDHTSAAENIMIQAMAYTTRMYGQRTTR